MKMVTRAYVFIEFVGATAKAMRSAEGTDEVEIRRGKMIIAQIKVSETLKKYFHHNWY